MYALGVVLYELFTLVDLSHDTLYQEETAVLASRRARVVGSLDALPEQFASLKPTLAAMLSVDPVARPTAQEVYHTTSALLDKIPDAGLLVVH